MTSISSSSPTSYTPPPSARAQDVSSTKAPSKTASWVDGATGPLPDEIGQRTGRSSTNPIKPNVLGPSPRGEAQLRDPAKQGPILETLAIIAIADGAKAAGQAASDAAETVGRAANDAAETAGRTVRGLYNAVFG